MILHYLDRVNLANILPPLTRHHRCAEDLYQTLLTAVMPTLTFSSMQRTNESPNTLAIGITPSRHSIPAI